MYSYHVPNIPRLVLHYLLEHRCPPQWELSHEEPRAAPWSSQLRYPTFASIHRSVACQTKALAPYEAVCTGAAAPIALGAAWKGLDIIKGCNNALVAAVWISLGMKIWMKFQNQTIIPSFKRAWGQTFHPYPHTCQSWFVFFPLRPRLGLGPSGMEYIVLLCAIYRIKPNESNAGISVYQSNQLSTIKMPFWQRHKSSFDKLCKSLWCTILVKIQSRVEFSIFLSLSDTGTCSKPLGGKNISCNASTPLASCGMRHLLRLSQNDAKSNVGCQTALLLTWAKFGGQAYYTSTEGHRECLSWQIRETVSECFELSWFLYVFYCIFDCYDAILVLQLNGKFIYKLYISINARCGNITKLTTFRTNQLLGTAEHRNTT